MSEMRVEIQIIPIVEQIKKIITSKNWYSLTESGRFIWGESVKKMADQIGKEIGEIEPEQLRRIIESSFTEEALSRTSEGYFVDSLLKIDPNLILWSEGDPTWQQLKAANTGLLNKEGLITKFISKEKTTALKELISALAQESEKSGEKTCIIVIDDKPKNLTHAAGLQAEITNPNIIIKTFLLNLKEASAKPDACLQFILQMRKEIKNIKIIVDMDGVIIDTYGVLAKLVPAKIASILK